MTGDGKQLLEAFALKKVNSLAASRQDIFRNQIVQCPLPWRFL
jgi:hypothetical protein